MCMYVCVCDCSDVFVPLVPESQPASVYAEAVMVTFALSPSCWSAVRGMSEEVGERVGKQGHMFEGDGQEGGYKKTN